MNAELIDSHVHLDSELYDEDREDVIKRAVDAGVKRLITIGASKGFDSAMRAVALAEEYEFIFATAGIHPHSAAEPLDQERLLSLCSHQKVVAVGETGLDFFKEWAPRDSQFEWFLTHINVAKELGKPLVIHSRNAANECYDMLVRENAEKVGGVFHCYAEDYEFANKLADINFLVSFPGIVTFKNAEATREAVKKIPINQILVETDAPYLAPEPFRGKRCESAFMVETAKKIAEVKGISYTECARALVDNTVRLFKL